MVRVLLVLLTTFVWVLGVILPQRSQMPERAKLVKPPKEFLPHTNNGNHARKPFGKGFMMVEQWDKIKDDHTQWSEFHMRKKMLSK